MSAIPVSLTQEQFECYIRPSLSVAKRGYECRIPLYKVFNYILYRLHTGCQWARVPIDPASNDPPKKKSAIMPSTITIANGARTVVWSACFSTVSSASVTRSTRII
ncbi:MAG: hypothetical protein EA396_15190 [Anaerolineaceae bacterium]|nr:MAG: hypothetical protein EA396_15190 [Anaerolineaceae bacterium]